MDKKLTQVLLLEIRLEQLSGLIYTIEKYKGDDEKLAQAKKSQAFWQKQLDAFFTLQVNPTILYQEKVINGEKIFVNDGVKEDTKAEDIWKNFKSVPATEAEEPQQLK